MSLPKELSYSQVKPIASDAKPEILRFRSQNQNYKSSDIIRVEIPTGRGGMHMWPHATFLEGKITVNITTTAGSVAGNRTVTIDQNIYSCFKRYRIIHGNETEEDLLHPNRLWGMIYDLQKSEPERNSDSINLLSDPGYGRDGKDFIYNQVAGGVVTGDTASNDFAFVIPSALIGSLATTGLPLSLMGASSLYLELELDAGSVAFYTTDASVASINSFTVSDIYLNAKISTLPSNVEQGLIASTGGMIILPGIAYKGELKTLSIHSATFNDKFAFNFRSIKAFLFANYNQDIANGKKDTEALRTTRSVTTRSFCNLNGYYLTLNGIQYPSQEIATPSVMYMNLLRAYDGMTDTNFGGILRSTNYSNGTGLNTDTTSRFIGGIDLDRYSHSSDILVTGTNTTGQNVNLVQNFDGGVPANINVYGFVMYDVLYELNQGLLKAAT